MARMYSRGYLLCTKCCEWFQKGDEANVKKFPSGKLRCKTCSNQLRVRPWSSASRRRYQEYQGVKRIE